MEKDLFGSATVTPIPNAYNSKPSFLERYRFTLKLDQAIVVLIALLIAYVLVFSFGVESGKRYAMSELKAERAKRERMAQELGEKIFANQGTLQAGTMPVQRTTTASALPVSEIVSTSPAVKPDSPSVGAAPQVPAAVTPASVNVSHGKFAIQVITFTSKAAAEQQVKKFLDKGYSGIILPKGKYQQVCITGFETRDKAIQALGELKARGLVAKDAYIRPLSPQ